MRFGETSVKGLRFVKRERREGKGRVGKRGSWFYSTESVLLLVDNKSIKAVLSVLSSLGHGKESLLWYGFFFFFFK